MIWTLLVISYTGAPWGGYSSTIPFASPAACQAAIPQLQAMLGADLDGSMKCVTIGAGPGGRG